MNQTQKYRKRLESMSVANIKKEREIILDRLTVNSNALIRSSLNSRLRMIDAALAVTKVRR